ncbi:MAG: AMP-binding protein [Corynebacterium sp.]|nr:AMP-binding protein [Corynebacterium sp.]
MHSTMQEIPLSVARIFEYGRTVNSETTIKTARSDNRAAKKQEKTSSDSSTESFNLEIESQSFREIGARTAALAHVLDEDLGATGDARVATFMFNCSEHLEILFASACKGAVFHPLNIQLSDEQLIFIINHAQDKVIFADPRLATRLARIVRHCACVKDIVFISGYLHSGFFPSRVQLHRYEELLDSKPSTYEWPALDENTAAALCYSTSTAGAPKGVLFSHRSLYLHSLYLRTTDSFAISQGSTFLATVPIYHVLSWGVPLAAFMCGAPLVFIAEENSPEVLAEVIASTHPVMAAGMPSVWTSLYSHYENNPPTRMSLREIFAGGAPAPPNLIRRWEQSFGVDVIHCWGMTEMSPVGTVARPPAGLHGEQRWDYRISQGRFPASVDYRVVNDGSIVTGTDRNHGEIYVRGPWVTKQYYRSDSVDSFNGEDLEYAEDSFIKDEKTGDIWFATGDVGSVTHDGFLTVEDRIRDVIRSGGEWIYSVPLENLIMANEEVYECAVIGHPDPTWGERPLAVVRLNEGFEGDADLALILAKRMKDIFPQWMIPEYWSFVKRVDKTSVGKFDKIDLRANDAHGYFNVIRISLDE